MDKKANVSNSSPPMFRPPNHQILINRSSNQKALLQKDQTGSPEPSIFSDYLTNKLDLSNLTLLKANQSSKRESYNNLPVKFHQLKVESPNESMLLDYSERNDLVAGSPLGTPMRSPKMMSIEEYAEQNNKPADLKKLSLDKIDMKHVAGSSGPKIVITPAAESQRRTTGTRDHAKVTFQSLLTLHNQTPKRSKTAQFKKRITRFFRLSAHEESSPDKVGDQIHKKQMQSVKGNGTPKMNSGRLLDFIAGQALHGKNQEVSKAFKAALTRVNAEALEKAQMEGQKKKMRCKHFARTVRGIFSNLFTPWRPDSKFIVYWKVLLLLAILVQSFLSPFILSFLDGGDTSDNTFSNMGFIVDVIYVVSILIKFRTAYYHQGELRTKSSDIVLDYLKGGFLLDIVTEVSLIGRLTVKNNTSDSFQKYLVLLTILRIYQIRDLIASIEDHFQFSRGVKTMLEVVKMCIAIFILAHWFGCILYSVTKTEVGWPTTWVTVANLQDQEVIDVYAASLYWAVATMSTVGYGDITPQTTRERMVTVVIMIFSSIVFGFLLSSIGSLLLDFSTFSSESREKMRLLNKYMREKGLSKDIQHRIRRYLEFYLAKENALRTEGDNTIQLLSQSLKDDIIKEVNAKLLNDTYMFSFNFRKKFLYLISRDFTEKAFGPDEIIFRHGDHDDFSVYFIISGKVEIYYEKCEITLTHLQKGDTLGFLAFFSGKPRTATARSLEFTTVFVMDRAKFQKKLEEFPTEKEMYTMIHDSLNHYNNYQFLGITCYSCGSNEHIALDCPKVHFNYNRQKIITNHLLEEENFRSRFQRKTRKKVRALKELEGVQEAAAQHQMVQQNELYFDNDENDENAEIRSYSSIDDVFDRNLYDPQPLSYTVDATQVQAVVLGESETVGTLTSTNSTPLLKKHKKKKGYKKKMGEIETFVNQNYDKYYHTLSIDKVKNFEVYNPGENITKMIVAFEKVRLQKIVENRLGAGARHISRLLVKGFKMNEIVAKAPSMSSYGSVRSVDTDRKNSPNTNVPDNFRRVSVSVNPADIAMYNSGERKMFPKGDDSASKTKIQKDTFDVLLKVPGIQPSNVAEVKNTMVALHANKMDRQSSRSKGLSLAKKKDGMSIDDKIINKKDKRDSVVYNDDSKRKVTTSSEEDSQSSSDSDSSSDTRSISASKSKKELLGVHSDNEEKLPTASFGEEKKLTKKMKTKKIVASMTGPVGSFSSSQLLSKKVARKSVFEASRPRNFGSNFNFGSEMGTMHFDPEESGAKKPVAMFDFTQLLKKMTTKLEENSSHLSSSTIRSKESPYLPRKETPSQYKKAANKQDLFITLLHQKNQGTNVRTKVRSSSAENGKEVKNFIDKHNLEEIMQPK